MRRELDALRSRPAPEDLLFTPVPQAAVADARTGAAFPLAAGSNQRISDGRADSSRIRTSPTAMALVTRIASSWGRAFWDPDYHCYFRARGLPPLAGEQHYVL